MIIPKLSSKDSSEILKDIKNLSKQYVPEWRFNEEDPDLGVIFSNIFANMFENTLNRYNMTLYNHYVAFLNLLGTKQMPPVSSNGMVTVEVVPNSKGIHIKKGASLYASADNDEGRVYYQTKDAMYAIDNRINAIFFTNSENDSITEVYNRDTAIDGKITPFQIFNNQAYNNLQSHEIYFKDDVMFKTENKSDFILQFHDERSAKNDKNVYKEFLDKENVKWQYYKNNEWHDIENVHKYKNGVRLQFDDATELFEVMGVESRCIRCVFNKVPDNPIQLTEVKVSSQAAKLAPNALLFDSTELSEQDFFPFGEQYNSYSDFYISSDEAFVKSGANIKLNIDMQFVKVKINTDAMNVPDNTRYKYIMTDLDFQNPEPTDIEIEKVSWEYWNGVGWAKLYKDNTNEDFFVAENGDKQNKELSFVCPEDMKPIVMGPYKSCFIRARILRIKNQFNVLGNYITPYIHNVSIEYNYSKIDNKCEEIYVYSDMEKKRIYFEREKSTTLLKKSLNEYPSMYICLEKPILNKGPVKILFDIDANILRENPSLKWEYLSTGKYGKEQWETLEVFDLTDNFLHTAIVTFIGKNDFKETTLFGKTGYFIRICNHDKKYSSNENIQGHSIINNISINTVDVIQREERRTEYFSIENEEENKVCNLSSNNICDASVWVNEYGTLSSEQEEALANLGEDSVKTDYDEKGRVKSIWVKWNPISNILCAERNERAFEIDYNSGKIIFGNGRNGKIPAYQAQESIMVKYGISQGDLGNIAENQIQGFVDAIPFVKSVYNSKSMVGGINQESIFDAAKRMSVELSGMDRIISMNDFERAIRYNDRNIAAIKCIPHINNMSEEEVGCISVAILPNDYMQGYEKFLGIKKRVDKFIKEKAPLTLSSADRIDVFEVMYVEISVNLDIIVDEYNSYQSVYRSVYNKLKSFLDPIKGNFDGKGWNIGELPRKELIYNYIKTTKDIKWIKNIYIFAKLVTLEGKKEVDFEKIGNLKFTVPIFGEPEINISID